MAERRYLVDIRRNIKSSAHGARKFSAGINIQSYANAYTGSNDKPLSSVEDHVILHPMLAILFLLIAMTVPQDTVSVDPVPGMLPNGVGADEVAISAITDAVVQRCVQFFEQELVPQPGMRIDRRAMTSSSNLGQI